ncbi:MAG: GNAT family N-acetyltransferase [Pseudomonadota bacterium]|nr:GNAT family N-acetyltransferase [Pseudomonadota bacterium]
MDAAAIAHKQEICAEILATVASWIGPPARHAELIDQIGPLDTIIHFDGDAALGFIALAAGVEDHVEITLIAVRRARHGEGIGRRLIHDAAAFARTHDYPALAVSWVTDDPQGRAHRAPRHFFTRLGFRPPLTAARGPLLLRPVRRHWLSA